MCSHFVRLVSTILLLVLPMAAQVGGAGTTNHVPLWTSTSNLGNSILIQSGGNIGVGNSSPVVILDVSGKTGTNTTNGGNAPTAVRIAGGLGAGNLSGFGTQGAGGPIQVTAGTGVVRPGQRLPIGRVIPDGEVAHRMGIERDRDGGVAAGVDTIRAS